MSDQTSPVRHAVYRTINKPLLLMGIDRRLFFLAVVMVAVVFNLSSSPLWAVVIFGVMYAVGRWATNKDPQMIPIFFRAVINPEKYRPRYDPAKIVRSNLVLNRKN